MHALQGGKIQRLGDDQEYKVDVRVIAATNVDIKQAIAEKALRQDFCETFYWVRFSAKTPKKWERMMRTKSPASLETAPAQASSEPLPKAAVG